MKLLYNFIFSLMITTSYLKAAQITADAQVSGQKTETVEHQLTANMQAIDDWFKAADKGYLETIQKLIKIVDVNAQDKKGNSALKLAAYNGHEHIVKFLLQVPHINVNLTDGDLGETPLMSASQFGYENIVKLLLERPDIDVNLQSDLFGTHVLHKAIKYPNIVELLLTVPDIKINVKTHFGGLTPWQEADVWMELRTQQLLAGKIKELTPQAFDAIMHQDLKKLKSVINQIGVDDIFDENGNTLLDQAFAINQPEIIFFLLQNADDPVALLDRFPFEKISPSTEIFELLVNLAYGLSSSQKIDPANKQSCVCANCAQTNCSKRCGGCKEVYYCSADCQKKHWEKHKASCNKVKRKNS